MANIKKESTTETGEMRRDTGGKMRRVLSASTLAGDKVQNRAGEDLGKVEELMIDIPTGKVAYAVLSFGGFLGMGSKLFAVPWNAFTVDEDEKQLLLNVEKNTLENAPGFDKDNWPDMADQTWGRQIYDYYGYKPYWDAGEDTTVTSRERDRTLTGGGGL